MRARPSPIPPLTERQELLRRRLGSLEVEWRDGRHVLVGVSYDLKWEPFPNGAWVPIHSTVIT